MGESAGQSAVDTNVEAPYADFMNLQVFAEFRLDGGEERFHHGVVVAIPPAAHAARNAVRREQSLITLRMPVLLSRGSRAFRSSTSRRSQPAILVQRER